MTLMSIYGDQMSTTYLRARTPNLPPSNLYQFKKSKSGYKVDIHASALPDTEVYDPNQLETKTI
jgi:hypothetical protein